MSVAQTDTRRYLFTCGACGGPGWAKSPNRRFHNGTCRKRAWREARAVCCTCDRSRKQCDGNCRFAEGGTAVAYCRCPAPLVIADPPYEGGRCLTCGHEPRRAAA